MSDFEIKFQQAVHCIDTGDEVKLKNLLDAHPELATKRLMNPGDWLRNQIGPALDSFFKDPYLLWFVSEDAVRNNTLPKNIGKIASIIIQNAKFQRAKNIQKQLDYGLKLVAWSWVARESGVQNDLINVFVDEGASVAGVSRDALVNGNFHAAELLVERGDKLTLAVALSIGKWEEADTLAISSKKDELQFSLVVASLNGNSNAISRLIRYGANVNKPSKDLYSHGTPLHHAVWSGDLESVKLLLNAGAKLNVKDKVYKSTPLGWAEFGKKDVIADYLLSVAGN